jgi:hypothetical protein
MLIVSQVLETVASRYERLFVPNQFSPDKLPEPVLGRWGRFAVLFAAAISQTPDNLRRLDVTMGRGTNVLSTKLMGMVAAGRTRLRDRIDVIAETYDDLAIFPEKTAAGEL